MTGMKRTSKRKLAVFAAVAALAGGAVAAVTALGEGTGRPARHARAAAHGRVITLRDRATAAGYLGISPEKLGGDMQAGKSLAEVANATPGKSAAGLIAALVAEKRQRLETRAATLSQRVAAEVNRGGHARVIGARGIRAERQRLLAPGPKRPGSIAAEYLGISPATLQADLQAGRSLAQVADASKGRSAIGLIGAIVAAKREVLAEAVASHRITQARANEINARLLKRVKELVERRARR